MNTLIPNKMPAFWHQFDFITLLNSPHARVCWDYDVDYFSWERNGIEITGRVFGDYHIVSSFNGHQLKKEYLKLNVAITHFFAQKKLVSYLAAENDDWITWSSPESLIKAVRYKTREGQQPSQQECLENIRNWLVRLIDLLDRKSYSELNALSWTGYDAERWREIEMTARMAYLPISLACYRAEVCHD